VWKDGADSIYLYQGDSLALLDKLNYKYPNGFLTLFSPTRHTFLVMTALPARPAGW